MSKDKKRTDISKRVFIDYKSPDEMVKAHRSVLKSLIDKDLVYDTKEAVEINNAFGKQLNYMKIILETHKICNTKPMLEEDF